MSPALYGVYGAGGCGRGVMPLLRDHLTRERLHLSQIVYIDDNAPGAEINGHRVLSYENFIAEPAGEHAVVVAVAHGVTRARLADQCSADGVRHIGLKAGNVVVMDDVALGDGFLLSPFVTLTSNIRIGRHFHANLYSYVEHDCVIGDYVTFAPGVKCNGNVAIGDYAYVGAGAVIRQGEPGDKLTIGHGAVIGMGAVVTRNVPAGITVVGNPAKPLLRS